MPPPIIRWKCSSCGNERMMTPTAIIVLCDCNLKNMVRIGATRKLSSLDKEIDGKLFDD